MSSITPAATALPAAYDPFADLKQEIRTVVTESANDVFAQQQPMIQQSISGAITDQLPNLRSQLQTVVDGAIDRAKQELPGVIDAEVARQKEAIGAQVKPIVEQQTANVRHIANSAIVGGGIGLGAGAISGFLLGRKAWNGASGGLLAAAGLAALGATAGALVGGWRGVSTLD